MNEQAMIERKIQVGDILVLDDRYIVFVARVLANGTINATLRFDIINGSFTEDEIDFNARRRLATEAEKVMYCGYVGMINMVSLRGTI